MIRRIATYMYCVFLLTFFLLCTTACSVAPSVGDRPAFVAESTAAREWFEYNVPGLESQISGSGGYAIFPGVGQWGIILTGGKFGRGYVGEPDHTQIGWAAINTGSIGLQAGVQGFKMLVVFQDDATLDEFRKGNLAGSVSAVAVAGDAGASGTAPFRNGVAVYQGANTGLMAGVNIGLDYMRYVGIDEDED